MSEIEKSLREIAAHNAEEVDRLRAEVQRLGQELTEERDYGQACDKIITSLRAATQWRPIESAPRDVKQSYEALITGGTRFNTADCFGGGAVDKVDWTACAEWSVSHQRWQSDDCSSGYEEYWVYEPTHWLPLPPPRPPSTRRTRDE